MHLLTKDDSIGEAQATLLAAQTATFCGPSSLILEGDALTITLAINSPNLFAYCNFASIISYISLQFILVSIL
jgi:hypothetical protein